MKEKEFEKEFESTIPQDVRHSGKEEAWENAILANMHLLSTLALEYIADCRDSWNWTPIVVHTAKKILANRALVGEV